MNTFNAIKILKQLLQKKLGVEQLCSIILFQPLNVIAQGLLRDKQPVGGAGHVQVFGQLGKVVQTGEIHGNIPTNFFC